MRFSLSWDRNNITRPHEPKPAAKKGMKWAITMQNASGDRQTLDAFSKSSFARHRLLGRSKHSQCREAGTRNARDFGPSRGSR
jgi:hypothetical protein